MASQHDKDINKEKRKEWNAKNKDKLAEYARKLYHKKAQEDPDYRKKLADRVRINRLKRKEALKHI